MKLRNKKTGEHGEYKVVSAGYLIRVRNCDTNESYQYDCIAGFNENWEDYKPKEPLIKDEKVRKLVLAWAKLTQTTKILTVKRRTSRGAKFTEFFSQEKCISLEFLGRFEELEDGKEYDITELCRSEE